jgi:PKD repeat protein
MRVVISLRNKLIKQSFCALIFLISAVSGQVDYSKWNYHQKIYINTANLSLTADIVNFPVLIRVIPTGLDGYSKVKTNGADIRFSKSDNSTPLSYEIEKWDSASGAIWVKIDTVFKNNSLQYIVMHYGNATAADSSSGSKVFQTFNRFAGVWHMNETPVADVACIIDRTSNKHDGMPYGTIDNSNMRQVSGITGSAINFNGTDNYIDLANPSALIFGKANISVSAWINTSSTNPQGIVIKSNNGTHERGDKSFGVSDSNLTKFGIDNGWVSSCRGTSNVTNGKWHHLVWTQKAADTAGLERWLLYVDGVKEKSLAIATIDDIANHTVQIGQSLTGYIPLFSNRFNGQIDEVEISDTTRSPDWIKLSFETQKTDQITVCFRPKIVTQPHDTMVILGDTAAFFIAALGDSLKYKWQTSTNGTTWKDTGSTGIFNKFKTSLADTNTRYRCIVTSRTYSDTSTAASVTLCSPVKITTEPADKAVIEGQATRFSISATGNNRSYQWQRKSGTTWNTITGATDTFYSITTKVTDNGALFRCLVSGQCGVDTSLQAALTVYSKAHASFKMSDSIGPAPLSVTFNDSSSGSISKWKWYFGDGESSVCSTSAKQVHVFDSAGTYTVKLVVEGPGGADSMSRSLKVYLISHASFKMSDSIGTAPFTVTFNDSSSGSISKWKWYFGDGKSSVCSTSAKQVHVFDSAGTYTVKLVVEGLGGADSISRSISVYLKGGNPIVLTGRYIAPDMVELFLKNYGSLQTVSPPPFVSELRLWVKSGALPLDTAGSKLQKKYNLASLKTRGSEYLDTVKVTPLLPADSMYGFATQILWNDGNTTPFTKTNGFLVLMRDTVKPANVLKLSALYTPKDTVTFYLDSIQKIDTLKVDSAGLWYGLGTDTVPNFASNAAVKWWPVRDIIKGASGNRFKYQLKSDQFNTDSKMLTCAVLLIGKNDIRSAPIKTSLIIGDPLNPIHLHATTINSNSIRLTWNQMMAKDSVEQIRIYYTNRDTLPYDCNFSAITVDSIVPEPKSTDTAILVSNLKEKTRYYFGARVYKKGIWSRLTSVSVARDSTTEAVVSEIKNTVILSKLEYDTASNNLRIFWRDTSVDSGFQLGVSFTFTSGLTPSDTIFEKIVTLHLASDSAAITLDSSIPFDQDLNVYLWLRKSGEKWAAPTPQSTGKIHIPPFTWQKVYYHFDQKEDTTSWANGQIRFITPPTEQTGGVNCSGVIRSFKIDSSKAPGFIVVGSSFVFSEKQVSPPFSIYIKCTDIPSKHSLRDVRIYRFDGNRWIVDRGTQPGSDSLSVFIQTNNLDMPFAVMIDTVPPVITVLSHRDQVVDKGITVIDTVCVSDNTGNTLWTYQCAKGENPFSSGDQSQKKMLSNGSDTVIVFIKKEFVSEDNGVRAQLLADDGHSISIADLSRRVVREKSDPTLTKKMKWVPLRVTARLDTPSADRLLEFVDTTDSKIAAYDSTLIRLFRWYPNTSNKGSSDKWVEYSNGPDSIFEFKSGRLLWVKTRNPVLFDFGRAKTMSLTDTVEVPLNKKEWTDFAVPFMFNIRVGDLISATRKTSKITDSLQIYEWIKDTSGTYHCEPFFLATRNDNGLDSLPRVMNFNGAGFSVYNPCDIPVTLRIPPVPESISPAGGTAKRATAEGWVIRVIPRFENGTEISSVYCGYSPGPAVAGTQYYPLPPRFGGPEVGVVEEQSGQLHGSAIFHEVKNGGCAYLLSLYNKDKNAQTMRLELARWGNLPSGMKTTFYNPLNGQVTNVSGKEALAVNVEGQTQAYLLLFVGDDNYIASGLKKCLDGKLELKNVYPNPLRGAMHLQYMVPFAKVSEVNFKILDLMGKTVWQTTIKELTVMGGIRNVTWNGATKTGTHATAGIYLVTMTAYDFKFRAIGSFNRKIMVLR